MKRIFTVFMCVALAVVMCFNLAGCGGIKAQNLMKNITAQEVESVDNLQDGNIAATDFAIRLFKECDPASKNTLISPISVMYAIAMTANGADGETLSQIGEVLGMSTNDLNNYLYSYKNSLSQDEDCKLNLANSIWFNKADGFKANEDFLQTNANYFGADIYKADFTKKSTVNDINDWVSQKTDKFIPEIVDNIDDNDVMFLINTVLFDAQWSTKYTESNIKSGVFTNQDNKKQSVKFMHSTESHYIETENAVGFLKYYESRYGFVALLPNEGTTVSECINSLNGEKINTLLDSKQTAIVKAALPEFKNKYELTMNDILKQMGVSLAFDECKANLSRLGVVQDGNLYIGEVLHKTYIDVNKDGTKAGAATKVVIKKKSVAKKIDIEIKTVYLDRPFIYMIIDCRNNVPLFMGTVMSVN